MSARKYTDMIHGETIINQKLFRGRNGQLSASKNPMIEEGLLNSMSNGPINGYSLWVAGVH